MVSRTDPETMRFLNDCIFLNVQANPDGQELVANWYMRGSEKPDAPLKDPPGRNMGGLPRLWAKYIGHDDNRDFYMSNMKETTNMNHADVPRVVPADHVQPPPDRSRRRRHLHAAVPRSLQLQLRSADSARDRMPSAPPCTAASWPKARAAAPCAAAQNYSTWWNGGLRTVTYFHNMIGILTEIIGSPPRA